MEASETVEEELVVRGQRCKVTAVKYRTSWMASGDFLGKRLEVRRATTPAQAFEWWKNKAGMQQPEE
jgi:hypothetical protein